ncbi:MAG: tetratricopeptide repeat protein [Deltaproteobacteria bacterium]|nr:tetratricopeptide repeat protein [Deltaproteobacteria bacterium]
MKRAAIGLAVGALLGSACGPQVSEQAQRLSQSLVALAHESYGNGDLGDALRKGLQAVETDPANPDATYVVAFIYAARTEYVDAERYFLKTLALDDTYTDARNALGQIYNNQSRWTDAIAILERAAEDLLYPTPHLLFGNLGQAYLGAGQSAKAVEWLLRSVREEPLFCVGFYRLGDAFTRQGEDDRAEEALASALAVDDPGCQALQPAWRMLGEVRLRLGRPEEAAAAFARCVELDGRSADGSACAAALTGLPEPPAPEPPPAPPAP